MKSSIWCLLAINVFMLSCCNHRSYDNSCSINSATKSISELKQLIIEQGDSCAYSDLKIQFLDFQFGSEDLLPYAMIMANKYNYTQAYFDVFDCLTIPYWSDIHQIDSRTAKLAISYLLLAANKGQEQACEIVDSYSITDNGQDYVTQICQIYQ